MSHVFEKPFELQNYETRLSFLEPTTLNYFKGAKKVTLTPNKIIRFGGLS